MTRVAYVQEWEESERGWGTRPDGYMVYATRDLAVAGTKERLKDMRARELKAYGPNYVPGDYSRPCGDITLVEVTDEAYAVLTSKGTGGVCVDKLKELEKLAPPPITYDI
jgi:hypothetical protein